MSRKTFLTIVSVIAFTIGVLASFFSEQLLLSKGVAFNSSTKVWMSEVGVLLLAMSLILFLVRSHSASKTMVAIFKGNIVIHLGLMVTELIAYNHGVITLLSGIIPNCILHLILSCSLGYYIYLMNIEMDVVYD